MIRKFKKFLRDTSGLALVEAALLFPVLMTLSFGIYDLGTAIVLNQKVISAAQISADLLGRERSLTNSELDQSFEAAKLALDPYAPERLGIDVVGVKFDASAFPQECWRYTVNMSGNSVTASQTDGLGTENEGLIVVTAKYPYTPHFSGNLLGSFEIEERAYIRGRKNSYIPLEGGSSC